MSYIDLRPDQQRAIAAIDVRALRAAQNKCERDGLMTPMYSLDRLHFIRTLVSQSQGFVPAV